MNEHFRQSMSWLHTWCGLTCGWLLCALFLAGTLSVFREPITRWMEARPVLATELAADAGVSAQALTTAVHVLGQQAGTARAWTMLLPERRGDALLLSWRGAGGSNRQLVLHPQTGELIPGPWGRSTEGGRHFMSFHYMLHAGTFGFWLVGWIAMCALVTMISGVVVHKRIFKDFFTFRPHKGQRSWLDAHNVTAVLPLPFLLMIVYTGLTYFYSSLMPWPLTAAYGGDNQAFQRYQAELRETVPTTPSPAPAPAAERRLRDLTPLLQAMPTLAGSPALRIIIERPGSPATRIRLLGRKPDEGNARALLNNAAMVLFDNTGMAPLQVTRAGPPETFAGEHIHGVMAQLHVGGFGGWGIKWLYFLSGLMGTLMIATGLLLFAIKRRQKSLQEFGSATAAMYRLIDVLNIAAIAGSCIACIGFFYANRLIPAALSGRSGWEIRAFFYLWLLSLLHAALRPVAAAWREQLAVAAALCLLLPLLNWLCSGQQLLWYAREGDWQLAGVELTAISCGLLLLFARSRVRR